MTSTPFRARASCLALALILVGCSRVSAVISKHDDAGTAPNAASAGASTPPTPPRAAPIARNGPPATALAGSSGTRCAVRGGEVWCWGQPLGITDLDRVMLVPTRVENLRGVTSVSVSSAHACAVLEGGSIRCWGDNRWGQLGDGTTTERKEPVAVRGISGATQVSAGQHHTCAIVGGAAKCWGNGAHGQLGIGATPFKSPTPQPVRGLERDVTSIAVDGFGSCALASGRLKTWGEGTQPTRPVPDDAPIQRAGLLGVTHDFDHCCAYASDGFVCVTETNVVDSTKTGPPLAGITAMGIETSGAGQACAITNGTVVCFAVGAGEALPIRLPAPATQLAVARESACALAGGEVYCWGNRGFGALGDDSPAKKQVDFKYRREEPAPVHW